MKSIEAATTATLGSEQVRKILNNWSGEGLFRLRRLGDNIRIQELACRSCHALHLTSQYEERQITESHVPYRGGPFDHAGRPPTLWEVQVKPPREFANRTEHVPLPHTETVAVCPQCQGTMSISCGQCNGCGRVNCTFCAGSGFRSNTRTVTEPNPQGGTETRTETVQELCGSCAGGQVTCPACNGSGHKTCPNCDGAGKLKFFRELVAVFRSTPRDEVVKNSDLPDGLVLQARGEVLIDESAPRIETCAAVLPDVDKRIAALLNDSHECADNARLLFQQLRVERVTAHEVAFTYRSGRTRRLWIYGHEHHVHAPDVPWRWLLATALIGLGLLMVGGLALMFLGGG